ncbi:GDYXXLXY domain-containing protein [Arthrobacter sp. NEB 688]|uniref:GDYXXLXY domain-containing protein n=1 Tax=Arthrobacter sp. NEB 688 TaxID=904039 RepID=UPI00156581D9|nr:GDYXXLXY domain-containing protein [Arthrobacter sp. NEB 688]QKE85582.1 GDYXXLXY domain-containing protein [Arthrobacter sp. NEB 688]
MTGRTGRVVAATLAQLVLVGVVAWAPLSARLTGEEVRLRVAPVDPYDPFRGAYADLTYPDLPDSAGRVGDPGSGAVADRGTAFVPLTRSGDVWVGGPVQRAAPDDGLFLRCDDAGWRLECGIESWFLPQDDAAALGAAVRDGRAVATVRVDGGGHAALVDVSATP